LNCFSGTKCSRKGSLISPHFVYCPQSAAGVVMALWTFIREISGSNLHRDTGYRFWGFSRLSTRISQ